MMLTQDQVKSAAASGKLQFLRDGANGLALRIQPNGSKSWIQRYSVNGKQRNVGLGRWPSVSLDQARRQAAANFQAAQAAKTPSSADVIAQAVAMAVAPMLQELQALRSTVENQSALLARLASGGGAVAVPAAASGVSFADVANAAYDRDASAWADNTAANNRRMLDKRILPALGSLDVASIEAQDIADAVLPCWQQPMGAKVLTRIVRSIEYAQALGHRASTIQSSAVVALLPAKRKAESQHHETVGYEALPAALARLDGKAADMLRFLAHTATRIGEVSGMQWHEVDLGAKVWTVPASRTKTRKVHEVPLSSEALALLPTAKRSGKVWGCGTRTAEDAMRRAGAATPHGLRSAFRSWCADTGANRELAETALGHVVGNAVERSYQRSSLLAQRATLMASWSQHLAQG